jgi:hypothetical protein
MPGVASVLSTSVESTTAHQLTMQHKEAGRREADLGE